MFHIPDVPLSLIIKGTLGAQLDLLCLCPYNHSSLVSLFLLFHASIEISARIGNIPY